MSHSKKIQFYRNNTVVRPDVQNEKTAFTVAKETFNTIENISDGEAVLVRYKEGDNDPIRTILGVYHLNGNVGSWTYLTENFNKWYMGESPASCAATYQKVATTEIFPVDSEGKPLVGTVVAIKYLAANTYNTAGNTMTLNVNNTGAYPIYYSAAEYVTTTSANTTVVGAANRYVYYIFNGSQWVWLNHGADNNTTTDIIGYQLRTNSTTLKTTDACRYYKIFFTSADGTHWVPASANSTKDATTARTVNQRPIDPFGRIAYNSATTKYAAEANVSATTLWSQYNLTLGYSFNRTGAALALTVNEPVYIMCAPQSNGSAIIDATTPYVQALPSTDDGKIYIFLGIASSATQVELYVNHPVYYHDGTGIRLWTGHEFAAVAMSGSYNDLTDTPTIPDISGKADKALVGTLTAQYDANDELTGYTCNKTYSQLTTAFDDGTHVLLHEGNEYNCYLYVHEKTADVITFYSQTTTDMEQLKVTISSSDVVSYEHSPVVWECGDY